MPLVTSVYVKSLSSKSDGHLGTVFGRVNLCSCDRSLQCGNGVSSALYVASGRVTASNTARQHAAVFAK